MFNPKITGLESPDIGRIQQSRELQMILKAVGNTQRFDGENVFKNFIDELRCNPVTLEKMAKFPSIAQI